MRIIIRIICRNKKKIINNDMFYSFFFFPLAKYIYKYLCINK